MESQIIYCDECGAYLGDIVNGILYKFGQVVTQPHICEKDTPNLPLREMASYE